MLPPLPLLDTLDARMPGFDRGAFVEAHAAPPPVSVRLNPAKPSSAFREAEQIPWSAQGRYLAQRPVFTLDPLLHAGAYYVQEASSQVLDFVVRSLFPDRSALRVLDLCAAPGGKSTLLASLLEPGSVLLSNEVIRTRVPLLAENVTRWGLPHVWVASSDPRDFGALPPLFDLMVVDAPCSGSGLFRKDADAVQHWSPEAVRMCADRQRRILADAWPCVKPGGVVVYATCSFSPEEDEDVADWLHSALGAEGIPLLLPEPWGFAETRTTGGIAGYRAMPHSVRGEGFFFAAVRKPEEESAPRPVRGREGRSTHDPKVFVQAQHLLRDADWRCLPSGKDSWYAARPDAEAFLAQLQRSIRVVRPGLPLGAPSAKGWIPAHDVALSVERSGAVPLLQASREEALLFLKKEETGMTSSSRGWQVVTYEGLGLGWVKALESRLNNYLPKEARIRMKLED